jgi:hypothetical protein
MHLSHCLGNVGGIPPDNTSFINIGSSGIQKFITRETQTGWISHKLALG